MVYTIHMYGIFITYVWYIKIFLSVYQNILGSISKYFRQYIQISIVDISLVYTCICLVYTCICLVYAWYNHDIYTDD